MNREWQTMRVQRLLRTNESAAVARVAGDRLLHLAAGLEDDGYVGLRLSATGDGTVEMWISTRGATEQEVTQWVLDGVANLEVCQSPNPSMWQRYWELVPTARLRIQNPWRDWEDNPAGAREQPKQVWPFANLTDGVSLLLALREISAEVRVHLAPANPMAAQMAAHEARNATIASDTAVFASYLGQPVAGRLLIGCDGPLPPRLRAALLARGIGLSVVQLDPHDPATARAWDGNPEALQTRALPFGAAQCLTIIPVASLGQGVCGLPISYQSARPVPLDDDACLKGIRLGVAVSNTGQHREVFLDTQSLLLHSQVLGATGSGKSSLLAGLFREACRAGLGVTVVDPHGQLVDRILAEAEPAHAASMIAIRSGDDSHPVPLNPLAGRNPAMMRETLTQVLRELHDPRNQGFMGPVWERWVGLLLRAQQELVGSRANLSVIVDMASDQHQLKALGQRIRHLNPSLGKELATLYERRTEEYADSVNWVVSKFERLVGSPVMQGILGTGEDAVDVTEVMDRQERLLIDLASPKLGNLSSQLLGEMWLAKHWEALSQRSNPNQPHLLIVDEAHLFGSGLLPRILTQARKYGVGVVLAHQNLEQLTTHLQEAALASTNNVFVFRTGLRETVAAMERLGNWPGALLTRLERLTAAVSLNEGNGVTDPFTLIVDHNERAQVTDPHLPRAVTDYTIARYGSEDAASRMLTYSTLLDAANTKVAERDEEGKGTRQRWSESEFKLMLGGDTFTL